MSSSPPPADLSASASASTSASTSASASPPGSGNSTDSDIIVLKKRAVGDEHLDKRYDEYIDYIKKGGKGRLNTETWTIVDSKGKESSPATKESPVTGSKKKSPVKQQGSSSTKKKSPTKKASGSPKKSAPMYATTGPPPATVAAAAGTIDFKSERGLSRVTVVESRAVRFLLTKLRDKRTEGKDFVSYGDRLMRILAEESLCRLPHVKPGSVKTPCGVARGLIEREMNDEGKENKLCVVSVVRSGDILLDAVRQLQPDCAVGKILIQRDEKSKDKRPQLFYKKLPKDIAKRFVILVDPMLATAGSAKMALSVLINSGVRPQNVMFVNLICAPEGLKYLTEEFPEISIVTAAVDEYLNEDLFIVPGLGDYGDRYYQTQ